MHQLLAACLSPIKLRFFTLFQSLASKFAERLGRSRLFSAAARNDAWLRISQERIFKAIFRQAKQVMREMRMAG